MFPRILTTLLSRRQRQVLGVVVLVIGIGLGLWKWLPSWWSTWRTWDAQILGAVQDASPAFPTPTVVPVATQADNFFPVTKVIDGDTIKVQLGEKEETVRLIGVDTPEVVDPRKPVQCFGKEASTFTKSLLSHQSVRLEADPSQQGQDKYQRLLRYVYLPDGRLVNQVLISEGYAREYTYQTPHRFQAQFRQVEAEARQAQKGLWDSQICPTSP